MNNIAQSAIRVIATILILAWLIFVWPTPYRYFKQGERNVRVNRFTGDTQTLSTVSGWH